MKIFIATNFDNKELIHKYSTLLKGKGYEVYNWIRHECIRPYDNHKELTKKYSIENINAIINSDVFILLNNQKCRNTYIELGIAIYSCITKNKPKIYLVGDKNSMYFYHPTISVTDSIEKVLFEIENKE